jgi:hypothetical protein
MRIDITTRAIKPNGKLAIAFILSLILGLDFPFELQICKMKKAV